MPYEYTYLRIATAIYRSLLNDPFYIKMEELVQVNPDRSEAMVRYIDYSMKEALEFGELEVPGDHKFGASIWSKPLDQDVAKKKKKMKSLFIQDHLGERSLETYLKAEEQMSLNSSGIVPKDSWYLSILGLKPEMQGKGLGESLMTKTLAKMDELGVSSYLETFTPRNIKFYNRLGYEEVDSFFEPTTGAEYFVLLRSFGG